MRPDSQTLVDLASKVGKLSLDSIADAVNIKLSTKGGAALTAIRSTLADVIKQELGSVTYLANVASSLIKSSGFKELDARVTDVQKMTAKPPKDMESLEILQRVHEQLLTLDERPVLQEIRSNVDVISQRLPENFTEDFEYLVDYYKDMHKRVMERLPSRDSVQRMITQAKMEIQKNTGLISDIVKAQNAIKNTVTAITSNLADVKATTSPKQLQHTISQIQVLKDVEKLLRGLPQASAIHSACSAVLELKNVQSTLAKERATDNEQLASRFHRIEDRIKKVHDTRSEQIGPFKEALDALKETGDAVQSLKAEAPFATAVTGLGDVMEAVKNEIKAAIKQQLDAIKQEVGDVRKQVGGVVNNMSSQTESAQKLASTLQSLAVQPDFAKLLEDLEKALLDQIQKSVDAETISSRVVTKFEEKFGTQSSTFQFDPTGMNEAQATYAAAMNLKTNDLLRPLPPDSVTHRLNNFWNAASSAPVTVWGDQKAVTSFKKAADSGMVRREPTSNSLMDSFDALSSSLAAVFHDHSQIPWSATKLYEEYNGSKYRELVNEASAKAMDAARSQHIRRTATSKTELTANGITTLLAMVSDHLRNTIKAGEVVPGLGLGICYRSNTFGGFNVYVTWSNLIQKITKVVWMCNEHTAEVFDDVNNKFSQKDYGLWSGFAKPSQMQSRAGSRLSGVRHEAVLRLDGVLQQMGANPAYANMNIDAMVQQVLETASVASRPNSKGKESGTPGSFNPYTPRANHPDLPPVIEGLNLEEDVQPEGVQEQKKKNPLKRFVDKLHLTSDTQPGKPHGLRKRISGALSGRSQSTTTLTQHPSRTGDESVPPVPTLGKLGQGAAAGRATLPIGKEIDMESHLGAGKHIYIGPIGSTIPEGLFTPEVKGALEDPSYANRIRESNPKRNSEEPNYCLASHYAKHALQQRRSTQSWTDKSRPCDECFARAPRQCVLMVDNETVLIKGETPADHGLGDYDPRPSSEHGFAGHEEEMTAGGDDDLYDEPGLMSGGLGAISPPATSQIPVGLVASHYGRGEAIDVGSPGQQLLNITKLTDHSIKALNKVARIHNRDDVAGFRRQNANKNANELKQCLATEITKAKAKNPGWSNPNGRCNECVALNRQCIVMLDDNTAFIKP